MIDPSSSYTDETTDAPDTRWIRELTLSATAGCTGDSAPDASLPERSVESQATLEARPVPMDIALAKAVGKRPTRAQRLRVENASTEIERMQKMLDALDRSGVERTAITLHVGYGTFQPRLDTSLAGTEPLALAAARALRERGHEPPAEIHRIVFSVGTGGTLMVGAPIRCSGRRCPRS